MVYFQDWDDADNVKLVKDGLIHKMLLVMLHKAMAKYLGAKQGEIMNVERH
jgi:hypothetical protein